jgi:hypothetical protein
MYRSTPRWTTAVAAAALITVPLTASAQQAPPAQPPQQQTQPTQPTTQTAPAPAAGQLDPAAAKTHLSAARDTLSQITALPEAAKLQGEARTQVSQVISNFNELITTQSEWRAVYSKVDASLTALLGPATADVATSGVTGAVGTAGTTGAPPAATPGPTGIQLDPAVRTKLVEFRKHLKEFEKAAGGAAPAAESSPASAPTDPPASAMPPTGATGATGTSGSTPAPAATADDKTLATQQAAHSEADKHLDAISAILDKSKSGALTAAQGQELKKHVAELRVLLKQVR